MVSGVMNPVLLRCQYIRELHQTTKFMLTFWLDCDVVCDIHLMSCRGIEFPIHDFNVTTRGAEDGTLP